MRRLFLFESSYGRLRKGNGVRGGASPESLERLEFVARILEGLLASGFNISMRPAARSGHSAVDVTVLEKLRSSNACFGPVESPVGGYV